MHELLQLRPLLASDCLALWQWRNDPHTRAMSLNTDIVPYDNHCKWFDSVLCDASQFVYIGIIVDASTQTDKRLGDELAQQSEKVGMVRFDLFDQLLSPATSTASDDHRAHSPKRGALVSINVNPEYRGKGLSVSLLKGAIDSFIQAQLVSNDETAVKRVNISYIRAQIKLANTASIKCFQAAGFVESDYSIAQRKEHGDANECEFIFSINAVADNNN